MPSKARPSASDVEKPIESTDTPPATTAAADGDDKPGDVTSNSNAGNDEPPVAGAGDGTERPQPGLYRFTWPYSCIYLLPDRISRAVETGEEIFWPDGAPDALWEFVSADEPAPAPSDNTPRE